MTLRWYGGKVNKLIVETVRDRIEMAGFMIEAEAKSLMKKGGRTASGEIAMKAQKGGKRKGRLRRAERVYKVGAFHSAPGESPRVQTGRLRRSIRTELHKVFPIVRVGTNVKYGKFLELGTPQIKARPWLRPAVHNVRKKILALLRKDIKSADIGYGRKIPK